MTRDDHTEWTEGRSHAIKRGIGAYFGYKPRHLNVESLHACVNRSLNQNGYAGVWDQDLDDVSAYVASIMRMWRGEV